LLSFFLSFFGRKHNLSLYIFFSPSYKACMWAWCLFLLSLGVGGLGPRWGGTRPGYYLAPKCVRSSWVNTHSPGSSTHLPTPQRVNSIMISKHGWS
jgi:hypothetical protein